MASNNSKKGGSRTPKCVRCRNHRIHDVPLKGHKNTCPYRHCQCTQCCLLSERKLLNAEHLVLQRKIRGPKVSRDVVTESVYPVRYPDPVIIRTTTHNPYGYIDGSGGNIVSNDQTQNKMGPWLPGGESHHSSLLGSAITDSVASRSLAAMPAVVTGSTVHHLGLSSPSHGTYPCYGSNPSLALNKTGMLNAGDLVAPTYLPDQAALPPLHPLPVVTSSLGITGTTHTGDLSYIREMWHPWRI